MIDVAVREDEGEKIASACKTVDLGVTVAIDRIAIQRQAKVEQDALTGGFQLDARAADFLRAAMNANPHMSPARRSVASVKPRLRDFGHATGSLSAISHVAENSKTLASQVKCH